MGIYSNLGNKSGESSYYIKLMRRDIPLMEWQVKHSSWCFPVSQEHQEGGVFTEYIYLIDGYITHEEEK
jgi:hypothetical protein